MGMSSSQARLLSLTSRMHDIEYKAQKLEAQKLQMANESAHVYRKYEDALNRTKIQGMTIGADGSAEFIDTNLLVLEGNAGDNLAGTIFLKNTYNDKIYVSRMNADKFQLPEDGNVGTEIEFMDRLGYTTTILGFDTVSNGNTIDNYTAVATVKGTQTQREVPNFNTDWGYQTVTSKPIPADAIAVSTVSSFDTNKTYVINTKEDLIALQTLTNNGVSTKGVNFILGGDIDLTGETWTSIGKTEALAFQGNFDGNGYTISNLTGGGGLFGYVKGDAKATNDNNKGSTISATYGVIKNVVVQNVNITKSSNETGALIGKNSGGYVNNCYSSGNIKSGNWAGGLIGHNVGGAVTSSTSNVNVTANGNCVGGFIGHDTNGTVQHCISTGDVYASAGYVGGFIGHETSNGSGFIFKCATTSGVTSPKSNKGAFLGQIDSGCTAVVIGSQYSGASGLSPVGSGANNMTSNGNDDSLTQGATKIVTTTNIIMPSKTSIKSNILLAVNKSGQTVPADFEAKLDTWLNQFYKEDTRYSGGVLVEDALKLASINDFLNGYLTNNTDAGVVSSIISDITNNSLNATAQYQDNYKTTKDYEYTGYADNSTAQAEKITSLTIGSAEDIANNLYTALKDNGHTELKYTSDVAKIQTWVSSKFNTNTEAGKLALAELNNIILSGDKNELEKIYTAINSNSSYTIPADKKVYNDATTRYDVTVTDQNQGQQTGWDRTDPDIDEALNFYEMIKGGYIIVEDEQASSTEWLTNMVNSGTAIFSQLDRTTQKPFETNVATNVLLQEVSDEVELKKAEAEYEASMRKIDNKDKRYDVELAHLENERNAIKTEIDTLKTVAKDNVDRTFKLFG